MKKLTYALEMEEESGIGWLRVLFIGLVLLSGFSLGSVDGSRAGDCRGLYPESCKPYALRCMSRIKPPFLPYSPASHIPVVTFLSLYHLFLSFPPKKINKNQKMPSHIFGVVHKLLRADISFPSFPFFGFVHVHFFFEKSLLFMLIKKVGNRGKISRVL